MIDDLAYIGRMQVTQGFRDFARIVLKEFNNFRKEESPGVQLRHCFHNVYLCQEVRGSVSLCPPRILITGVHRRQAPTPTLRFSNFNTVVYSTSLTHIESRRNR